jgi:hypothetical protein
VEGTSAAGYHRGLAGRAWGGLGRRGRPVGGPRAREVSTMPRSRRSPCCQCPQVRGAIHGMPSKKDQVRQHHSVMRPRRCRLAGAPRVDGSRAGRVPSWMPPRIRLRAAARTTSNGVLLAATTCRNRLRNRAARESGRARGPGSLRGSLAGKGPEFVRGRRGGDDIWSRHLALRLMWFEGHRCSCTRCFVGDAHSDADHRLLAVRPVCTPNTVHLPARSAKRRG